MPLSKFFGELPVFALKGTAFCRESKKNAQQVILAERLKIMLESDSGCLFFFQETYLPSPTFIFNLSIFNQFA